MSLGIKVQVKKKVLAYNALKTGHRDNYALYPPSRNGHAIAEVTWVGELTQFIKAESSQGTEIVYGIILNTYTNKFEVVDLDCFEVITKENNDGTSKV